MRRRPMVIALLALILAVLALAACQALPVPQLAPVSTETLVPNTPCAACDQTTQLAALTQANINANAQKAQASATADILVAHAVATAKAGTATQSALQAEADINAIALRAQAAATADILRAQALATFNAANSTQGAAQTQNSQNASALQAAVAATAALLRAQALATFNAASSTQSSAQTQVQARVQLTAQWATQSAAATATQQWMAVAMAGTATTLARAMIDQTQSAAELAQQAAERRQEQSQGPILFMWKWGLPIFMVAVAGLGLWGLWRWLRLHTARPRNIGQPAGGSVIIRERAGGLAESVPNLLRWIAWFVETRSTARAPAGPSRAVIVVASSQNAAPAATAGANLAGGQAPGPADPAALPFGSGVAEVAAENAPTGATGRMS